MHLLLPLGDSLGVHKLVITPVLSPRRNSSADYKCASGRAPVPPCKLLFTDDLPSFKTCLVVATVYWVASNLLSPAQRLPL